MENVIIGGGPLTGSGDPLFYAFRKINTNFSEIYGPFGGTAFSLSANKIVGAPDGSNGPATNRHLVARDFGSNVAANLVLAGATSGTASVPSFRSLVNADLPSQAALSAGTYTAGVVQMTVAAQGLITVVNRDGPATTGVTSVGFSADPIFTISGAPITAGSTITLNLAAQSANLVLAAGTSGGASAPRFRNLTPPDFGAGVTASMILAGPVTGAASTAAFRALSAPDLPFTRYSGQTSGYNIVTSDRLTVVDYTGSGDGTWSAEDCNVLGIGHLITVHNSSASGSLIYDGHSTQLIEGRYTNVTILPQQSMRLFVRDASTQIIVGGGSYLIRQTVPIVAEAFNSRTAQGATDGSVELGSAIVVKTKDFDPGTNWFIQKDFTLPDSFYASGPLTARYKASIASGSGVGVMGIQAIAYGSNSSLNVAYGAAITQPMTFVSGNVLTNSGNSSAPFVPAGAVAPGQTLKLQVYRDAGSASDTLATNLRLHEVIVEFDVVRFGSDY